MFLFQRQGSSDQGRTVYVLSDDSSAIERASISGTFYTTRIRSRSSASAINPMAREAMLL